ncbi:MAG TPA: hypothetical protein VJ846_12350, partial [Sphingomicrobium sp.]|nr:hypothetical protein [Sphingomicrobium sp.]
MFLISPLLGKPGSEYAKAGAAFVFLAGLGLVLVYNRWRFGGVFPVHLDEAQRAAVRHRAVGNQLVTLIYLA